LIPPFVADGVRTLFLICCRVKAPTDCASMILAEAPSALR